MQVESMLSFGGALAISALVSCGSSSTGGSGQFTTSVPAGTRLTSLSSQQVTQFCTDLQNYRPKVAPAACALRGIEAASLVNGYPGTTDSVLEMACTNGYNSCLNPDGGATASACDLSFTGLSSTTCTYTVGDLTTCLNMQITHADQEVSNLPTCSSLTTASLASASAVEADAGTGLSPTCMALNLNCTKTSTVGLAAPVNEVLSARK